MSVRVLWCVHDYLLLSISGFITELIATQENFYWYDYVSEIPWILCAIATWGFCHFYVKISKLKFDWVYWREFIIFILLFLFAMGLFRFFPFSPYMCPSSRTAEHVIGSIGALIVNILTMHFVTVYIVYLNLGCIHQFDHLIKEINQAIDIQSDEYTNQINFTIKYSNIKNYFKWIKKYWQKIVSIWFVYSGLFAITSFLAWFFEPSKHSWIYCYNDPATQIIIVLSRSTVRIFALLYSVVRLNRKPHELAKALRDLYEISANQEAKELCRSIQSPSKIGFKVCWLKMNMKHILWIAGTALLLFVGSLVKISISNL